MDHLFYSLKNTERESNIVNLEEILSDFVMIQFNITSNWRGIFASA